MENQDNYYGEYDNFARFTSYFYQIDLVRRLDPGKILEIGIGNKTVSNYLRHNGYDVTTCDYDPELEPDCVADIRQLPFEESSYDVVMACEIVEHLPWQDLSQIVAQLHKVTKRYVVISVPYLSCYLEVAIKFPMFNNIFKRPCMDLFLRWPFACFKRCSPSHQWEIGMKGFSLKVFRKELQKYFKVVKEVRPLMNPKHYFFVLEKTDSGLG